MGTDNSVHISTSGYGPVGGILLWYLLDIFSVKQLYSCSHGNSGVISYIGVLSNWLLGGTPTVVSVYIGLDSWDDEQNTGDNRCSSKKLRGGDKPLHAAAIPYLYINR